MIQAHKYRNGEKDYYKSSCMKNISINIVWFGFLCDVAKKKIKQLCIIIAFGEVYDKLWRYLKLIGVLYIFDLLLLIDRK